MNQVVLKHNIGINDIESDPAGPIWVINKSEGIGRSDLSFGVTLNGQGISVVIPQTWIPINLTEQAPKAAILNTQGFRRSVSSRLLS